MMVWFVGPLTVNERCDDNVDDDDYKMGLCDNLMTVLYVAPGL